MLSKENISNYGGKAAILNYVKEKLPHIPIPNYVVKQFGTTLDGVLTDFNSMKKPVIVRSSSPFEYGDFEGIFESIKNVRDKHDLERAVRLVEESAMSDRAKLYAEQNGFEIDEKMHSIIQEQHDSKYVGVMMRHPNNPDLIYLNHSTGQEEEFSNHYGFYVFNQKENKFSVSGRIPFDDKIGRFLVEKYLEIEFLKEIGDDKNLFVEYGVNPFALFQVRPFKKIETADFEVPRKDYDLSLSSELCFGITPPEGIVLPVLKSVGFNEVLTVLPGSDPLEFFKFGTPDLGLAMELANPIMVYKMGMMDDRTFNTATTRMLKEHNISFNREIGTDYCFMTSSIKNDDWDIDLTLPNMNGLIFGRSENFLTHNSMRLIKKANVSMLDEILLMKEFYKNTSSLDKVRIISNGKEAIAMRE